MISSEMAEKMVSEKMEREAKSAQLDETKPEAESTITPEPEPEKTEEVAEKKDEPEQKGEKKEEVPQEKPEAESTEKTEKAEKADKPEKKLPPSKRYSHDERMNHAFAREKDRRKKAEARNKELEAELAKFKGLTLADFENKTEDFVNWRFQEREMQDELARNKEFIKDFDDREAEAALQKSVDLSFDSDEDKDTFYGLLNDHGKDFYDSLKKYDPENVVLNGLNNIEKYPKVLKSLMDLSTGTLAEVFSAPDPEGRKANLERVAKRILEDVNPAQDIKQTPEPKTAPKPLPVIGKQVTASSKAAEPVHDRAYWNNYLKTHPVH